MLGKFYKEIYASNDKIIIIKLTEHDMDNIIEANSYNFDDGTTRYYLKMSYRRPYRQAINRSVCEDAFIENILINKNNWGCCVAKFNFANGKHNPVSFDDKDPLLVKLKDKIAAV